MREFSELDRTGDRRCRPFVDVADRPTAGSNDRSDGELLLVVPPFQSLKTPSLALGLLAGQLAQAGLRCRVLHLNLYFAEQIGPRLFQWISGSTTRSLLGEFVFSHLLFGYDEGRVREYVDDVVAGTQIARTLNAFFPERSTNESICWLAQQAAEFCDGPGLELILRHDPWLVGFTSTFQQNCSSLALMRRLKIRRPGILTVMGGANCDDEMGTELFDRFRELDFVARGECDHTFVRLVRSLATSENGTSIPGILCRGAGPAPAMPLPLQSAELDGLAYPLFHDYFTDLAASRLSGRISPGLVMETSRGCWWGAKQHCTFCGLNRNGMSFRSKSPTRALVELRHLVQEYGVRNVEMVDNILDMKFMKTLLPELAKAPAASLFYELKANLTRAQIRLLKSAGVTWIQAGLESLSDRSLKLMNKGTTQLQNIQVLKWCVESGVRIDWNYLYGFPGESDADLAQIAESVEAIHHLPPPSGPNVLRIDRFSPYFARPDQYGLAPIVASRPYKHIYPFSDDALKRLAYFFDTASLDRKHTDNGFRFLGTVVDRWNRKSGRSHLVAIHRHQSTIILDTRSCARAFVRRLRGLEREVYEFCGRGRSLKQIVDRFGSEHQRKRIERVVERLVADRLVLHTSGRYLALALELSDDYRDFKQLFPGGDVRPPNSGSRAARGLRVVSSLFRQPGSVIEFTREVFRRKREAATQRLLRGLLVSLATGIGQPRDPTRCANDRTRNPPQRSKP